MSTGNAPPARSSSPAAERMRLHRKRRREGMQYVQIPLHKSEVEDLIRLGLLQRCPSAPGRGAYHRLPSTGRGGVIRLDIT
jgi:hypothetical protein